MGVAEGAHAHPLRPVAAFAQHVQHAGQQHVGGGDQHIRQFALALQQSAHQAPAAVAAEFLALFLQHVAIQSGQRLAKARAALGTDGQFRPRAEQGDAPGRRLQQAAGELQAGLAVVADHRTETLRITHAVDGYHRQSLVQ
ncbi:hypothetical protein D3C72_2066680 [compost metagenome]